MKWFGEPWPSAELPAPVCEDPADRLPTPVGGRCLHCQEEIATEDQGVLMPYIDVIGDDMVRREAPLHVECFVRTGVGGPAHLQGLCSCAGGDCDPDMGLSPRDAARRVMAWLRDHSIG